MARTYCELNDDLVRRLDVLAAQAQVSRSTIISWACWAYVSNPTVAPHIFQSPVAPAAAPGDLTPAAIQSMLRKDQP